MSVCVKGLKVFNTPAASSDSVASWSWVIWELWCFCAVHDSNRQMPLEGDSKFGALKRLRKRGYCAANIGYCRLWPHWWSAQLAIGAGMKVVFSDIHEDNVDVINFLWRPISQIHLRKRRFWSRSNDDFISVHVPGGDLIGADELAKMKGVVLLNAARGELASMRRRC